MDIHSHLIGLSGPEPDSLPSAYPNGVSCLCEGKGLVSKYERVHCATQTRYPMFHCCRTPNKDTVWASVCDPLVRGLWICHREAEAHLNKAKNK